MYGRQVLPEGSFAEKWQTRARSQADSSCGFDCRRDWTPPGRISVPLLDIAHMVAGFQHHCTWYQSIS